VAPPKKKAPPRKASGAAKKRPGTAQAARAEKERRALRNRLIFGAILLVVAGIVIFAAASGSGGGGDASVDTQLTAGAGSCTVDQKFDGTAANQGNHLPNPTYQVDPPDGGPHTPAAAPPGFYTAADKPTDGLLVHSQEHGFVVLWYRPGLSEEKMAQLTELSDQHGRELLLVPRPSLRGEVAVTAWHHRLLCGELVPAKVTLFTRTYVDKGPEKGFL
jgi:hypothetical protein